MQFNKEIVESDNLFNVSKKPPSVMNKSNSALGMVKRLASPTAAIGFQFKSEEEKDPNLQQTPRQISNEEFDRFPNPQQLNEMVQQNCFLIKQAISKYIMDKDVALLNNPDEFKYTESTKSDVSLEIKNISRDSLDEQTSTEIVQEESKTESVVVSAQ